MIIDFHTHFYPEKVVEKALSSSAGIIPHYIGGTRADLEESMLRAGIDCSVGLALVNNAGNSRSINAWAESHNRPPIVMTGSIHPDEENPLETLQWIADAGMPGIKVHPEYQQFGFEEERLFPIWERCQELGLFLITHAGSDAMFGPHFRTTPESLAAFHRRFPGLKFVLAHLGGMEMWDDVERYLTGLDVYLDLAMANAEYISVEQLTRIIKAHGAERILFGTDSPWDDQKRQVDFIRSLDLTEAEFELIFHRNAAELLNLEK